MKGQIHHVSSIISKLTTTGLMKNSHQKADHATMTNNKKRFVIDCATIKTIVTFLKPMSPIEILMKLVQLCIARRVLGILTISMAQNTTIILLVMTLKVKLIRTTLCTEKGTMRSIGTQRQTQSITVNRCVYEPGLRLKR